MSLRRNAGLRAQNTARHNIAPSAEAGPPSKPNTPAAVTAAKGITTNSPGTKMTYSGPNQPSTSAPVGGRGFTCPCGRSFVAKPGLARHQKDCGSRDISKCQFCEASFPSFIGVRQHERRAHPDLYSRIWRPDSPKLKAHCWRKSPKSKPVTRLVFFTTTWWRLRGLPSTRSVTAGINPSTNCTWKTRGKSWPRAPPLWPTFQNH
jgi:hypothetical protein